MSRLKETSQLTGSFCRFVEAGVMRPQSAQILSLLLPLLAEAEREVLYLLLETIRAVVGLDKTLLNEQTVAQLAEMVYQSWLQHTQGQLSASYRMYKTDKQILWLLL